jgi:hypothetical protein
MRLQYCHAKSHDARYITMPPKVIAGPSRRISAERELGLNDKTAKSEEKRGARRIGRRELGVELRMDRRCINRRIWRRGDHHRHGLSLF